MTIFTHQGVITFPACTATDSIAMMVDEPLPAAGDNVTITFTANGLMGGMFIRLEKVLDDDEPVVVSTNHMLESPFSTMERYQMRLDADATNAAENKFVFVFSIVGQLPWTCSHSQICL